MNDPAAPVTSVADEGDVARAMAATLERFGRVDSCFANAGVGKAAAFTEMTISDWNAVVDINTIARKTIIDIGYDDDAKGFNGNTCAVMVALDKQSADIAGGVDRALELFVSQDVELAVQTSGELNRVRSRLLLDANDDRRSPAARAFAALERAAKASIFSL